jgi:ABC-type phosphate transport system substrate-binding protein
MLRPIILALLTGAMAPAVVAAAPGYKLIVHPENPTDTLGRAEVARIFMKTITTWTKTKLAIQPVDQQRTSPVRAGFSLAIHQKDADAISAHWQVVVYSGRDVPPKTLSSDEDVLAFVRSTPGGIGYVSEGASLSGVKEVSVK